MRRQCKREKVQIPWHHSTSGRTENVTSKDLFNQKDSCIVLAIPAHRQHMQGSTESAQLMNILSLFCTPFYYVFFLQFIFSSVTHHFVFRFVLEPDHKKARILSCAQPFAQFLQFAVAFKNYKKVLKSGFYCQLFSLCGYALPIQELLCFLCWLLSRSGRYLHLFLISNFSTALSYL